MQNSLIIDISNAHGGPGLLGQSHARLRVGHSYQSRGLLDGNPPARAPGLRSHGQTGLRPVVKDQTHGEKLRFTFPSSFSSGGRAGKACSNIRARTRGPRGAGAYFKGSSNHPFNNPSAVLRSPNPRPPFEPVMRTPAASPDQFDSGRKRPSGIFLHQSRPQIGRDHPLNLSISLSGGKETNQDSLSSGE